VGFILIVGGLYSVTALRDHDQERVTVYTKHRLTLQAPVTKALGSQTPEDETMAGKARSSGMEGERGSGEGCALVLTYCIN